MRSMSPVMGTMILHTCSLVCTRYTRTHHTHMKMVGITHTEMMIVAIAGLLIMKAS